MDDSETNRITGKLMGNYINNKAVIRGTLSKVEADGKRATMKTVDDEFVQLLFENQNHNASQGTFIEAVGSVMNRNQFKVLNFVQFSTEEAAKIDAEIHANIIAALLKYSQRINVDPVNEEAEQVLKNLSNDFAFVWDGV